MELLPLIRQHLYLEDDTIIPGLGGFTSRHHPARLVQETGTVIPPVREILFDPALQHNDGRLQQRVAGEYGVNLSRSRQLIDEFIQELRHRTLSGERIILDGIGYFHADEEGQVRFRLEPGANLNLDYYGMAPVHVHQLVPRSTDHLSVPGRDGRISRSQPEGELLQGRRAMQEGRPLKRVLIAIPLLFLLALLPNNPELTRRVSHDRAALGPDPSLFVLEYPESQIRQETREIVYPIGTTGEPAAEVPAPTDAEPVPAAVHTARYPLVAGLFRSESNARRYVEELTGKGYPAAITVTPSGFHRITIGSFETLAEAQQRVNEIFREDPSIKPWILR